MQQGILSRKEDWEEIWGGTKPMLTFNPDKPFFSDIHALLTKTLPHDKNMSCLEIGCYPGTYLWYFNRYFGYQPSGIEYVEKCVPACRKNMESLGIKADIRQADIFDFNAEEKWDVVFSVGLIEHFTAPDAIVKKHTDLIKPGGYLVLIIPNHSGFGGKILKRIDKAKYDIHNHMDYKAMKDAVENTGDVSIIEGGYYGRLGFWNIDLYPFLQNMGKIPYFLGRIVLYSVEHIAQYLIPNSAYFSPNCVVIARKPATKP